MKKTLITLLLFISITALTGCVNKDNIVFDLVLGDEITAELDSTFQDPGFIAKHNSGDISSYVTVENTVDTSKVGHYTITYNLDYKGVQISKERIVKVGNTNCSVIENSNLMACQVVWTQYLNTVVKLTIYVDQDTLINTDNAISEVEDILAFYTIMSDKYKDYDGMMNIYQINEEAGNTVTVDSRVFDLIEFTLDHQDEVNNLFNAALGPVLQVWHDYRENCIDNDLCVVPSMEVLQAANQYTDPSKVLLDRENLTVTMEENMSLDLGGVSKGYVSKKIIEYLDGLDIHGYLLNNGESNISVGGVHHTRENGKFIIAVTDPTNVLPYYATIYLENGEQLVTSGDYQKFYTVDDVKYHHIIHPTTLMPENYSRSVSIITTDPALADLYSTAIFNMTVTEGQDFVNGIDGLEAIWYGTDGTIYFSNNFETKHLVETFE